MKNVIISLPRSGSSSLTTAINEYSNGQALIETDDRCPISPEFGLRIFRNCDIRDFPEETFKIIIHHYTDEELVEIATTNRCIFLYREKIFRLALSMAIYEKLKVSQKYYQYDNSISLSEYYKKRIRIEKSEIDSFYHIYVKELSRLMRCWDRVKPPAPIFSYEKLYYTHKEQSLKFISKYFDLNLDIPATLKFLDESVGKLNTYENIINIDEIMTWEKDYDSFKNLKKFLDT